MAKRIFEVTFSRISRDRCVPPQVFSCDSADAHDELAERIWDFARPRCASRDIEVSVDLAEMRGIITAGFHEAGTFTIREKGESE